MYFVECISTMKQVYAYAFSKGVSDNDLLKSTNCNQLHTTEGPPVVWNSKILRKNAEK